MPLPDLPDWHTVLLREALETGSPVPGGVDDYVRLQDSTDALEAFDLFVRRWVHPNWHPHLMDSDDNEAWFVRRAIRAAIATAASAGFAAGAATAGGAR